MAKNTSALPGDYFENFIDREVSSGRYDPASKVVRTALRLPEQEQMKARELISELNPD